MLGKIALPTLVMALGIFSLYWAQTHAPDVNMAEEIARKASGSYTLSTPGYIFSLVFSTALIVLGGKRVVSRLRQK